MAGLAPPMMPAPAAPAGVTAPVAAPVASPVEGEGVPASPEEQQQYDKVVAAAMIALYDGAVLDPLVAALRDPADPPQMDIADVASSIALRVYQEAANKGVIIPGDVMMHAGQEIVEAAAEVAERLGLPMDEAATEEAFYMALDSYKTKAQAAGVWDEAGAAQDAETLQADPTMGGMMPGTPGAAPTGPAPAPGQPMPAPADPSRPSPYGVSLL